MTGKLKIVRVLANPKIRKRKKSAKVKRRKGTRQRAVRALGGKWVLRRLSPDGTVSWWQGSYWAPKSNAKKFATAQAAARTATAAKKKAGKFWLAIDVMPA